jgi:microcystin-dependent protein
MPEPFIGEIRLFGFDYVPRGWAFCDGQLLPIAQNPSLFSVIGPTYGGDRRTTFRLPDLRGRTPMHPSDAYPLAQQTGEEGHALTEDEMPVHQHSYNGTTSAADTEQPVPHTFAATTGTGTPNEPLYRDDVAAAFRDTAVETVGSGRPHDNMMPFFGLHFCIALNGLFPSQG